MAVYSDEKKEEIWSFIMCQMFEGKTLTEAIEASPISGATFYTLLNDKRCPNRLKEYACAREALADIEFDAIKKIAYARENDDKAFVGANYIQRDRLIIDTHKFRVGRMHSKYAESFKHIGDAESPIETKLTIEHVQVPIPIKTEESSE